MDLLSSYPLGCSLDSPGDERTNLLGVAEDLDMDDLEFPVRPYKSVGDDTIIVKPGPEDGRKRACGLRCG